MKLPYNIHGTSIFRFELCYLAALFLDKFIQKPFEACKPSQTTQHTQYNVLLWNNQSNENLITFSFSISIKIKHNASDICREHFDRSSLDLIIAPFPPDGEGIIEVIVVE